MIEEARIAARIPWAPRRKIFMNWDVLYGNSIRAKNTQIKGFSYWKPTHTDPKVPHKIGARDK